MTTAILSALPQEQAGLRAQLAHARCERFAGRELWCGELRGQPVVLALCGVGKVAAATTTTLLAQRLGARRVVFTGVAGGLGAGVRVGDLVLGTQYLQHDMDASPLFPKYEVPYTGRSRYDADRNLLAIVLRASIAVLKPTVGLKDIEMPPRETVPKPSDAGQSAQNQTASAGQDHARRRIHQGLIISGDRFVSTERESRALQAALPDALCVEMEGAAVAQVCHDHKLPFVAVRSISDRADDNAHLDFPQFLEQVAGPLANALMLEVLNLLQK